MNTEELIKKLKESNLVAECTCGGKFQLSEAILFDGTKPFPNKALEIQKYLESNTKARVLVWLGSCFGACDVPLELKELNIDLLVQFGHNDFGYEHLWR